MFLGKILAILITVLVLSVSDQEIKKVQKRGLYVSRLQDGASGGDSLDYPRELGITRYPSYPLLPTYYHDTDIGIARRATNFRTTTTRSIVYHPKIQDYSNTKMEDYSNKKSLICAPSKPANYDDKENYFFHQNTQSTHNFRRKIEPENYGRQNSYQHSSSYSEPNDLIAIPVNFARTVNNYSVSELLVNFVDDGPDDLPEGSFLSTRFGETTDLGSTYANLAPLANCIPELTTVQIAESSDPKIFYIPECTRIERCGGCCSHIMLECQPVLIDKISLLVMKTQYTGQSKLKYLGTEQVTVDKHRKCKCECKIKPEHCQTNEIYNENECRCIKY